VHNGWIGTLAASWQYCEVTSLAPTARSLLASRPAPNRLAGGAALLLLVLVVLALHLWLLGFAPATWGPAPSATTTRSGVPAMQVRAIVSPVISPVSSAPGQAPSTQPAAQPATATATSTAPAPKQSAAVAARPAVAHATGTAPVQVEASPPSSLADTPLPIYATQPAPPATLQYRLQRGLAVGTATLSWRPVDAGGYSLSLTTQAFGVDAISWHSVGQFDAAGLAPDRYSEARRGRELRASNFQKDAFQPQGGKLTFSAQATEHPLTPGMQDRLSWMLQLPAVLQANPALAVPGAQITLPVVGTRGAPEPWVFVVQPADEPTASPTGTVYLLREPRRPYDLRVHVWLDPQRHYLPVRMQLLVQATGEGNTFELESTRFP
jgi:Protein of unknown function (DUF3108)